MLSWTPMQAVLCPTRLLFGHLRGCQCLQSANLSVQQQFCDEVLVRAANEGWFRPSIVISVFVGWQVSVTSFEVEARVCSIDRAMRVTGGQRSCQEQL